MLWGLLSLGCARLAYRGGRAGHAIPSQSAVIAACEVRDDVDQFVPEEALKQI